MKSGNILVLDIGTTGVKGLVFDASLNLLSRSYCSLKKLVRKNRVEQDPHELLTRSLAALRNAVKQSGVSRASLVGLGITNQRETTIVWDAQTGKPIYPAIVWEDTRTAAYCKGMQRKHGAIVREKTGLVLDPYFSATKVRWILDTVPHAREKAASGALRFGTVDSWILWNFLEGHPHCTDYTNASRTMLFNLKTLAWDTDLLTLFDVPRGILPEVQSSAGYYGTLANKILGIPLPVVAVCGDQQASLFAAGLTTHTTKVTYGTGGFVSQVLGQKFSLHDSFFTTLGPHLDRPLYVLEAKVNDCGKRVDAVLDEPTLLKKVIVRIITEITRYLKKLTFKPRQIIVDGGITQYEGLVSMQARAMGVSVKKQKIYDGTALGTAMLVKRAREMKAANTK